MLMNETIESVSAEIPVTVSKADYSLTGINFNLAAEKGLAEADWYQCPVPREAMRKLLERSDGPAVRDTIVWLALIAGSGLATYAFWGSWWAVLPYIIYCTLYASTSDSRWHEAGHGTAFKTEWMNNALYELASFMVMRESTVWRWSHNRHHSDTIIVGRDPEISVQRPPDIKALLLSFFNITVYRNYFRHLVMHAVGRMDPAEATYIPAVEFPAIYRKARITLSIYLVVLGLSALRHSIEPLMFVGLTNLFGTWLMSIYGLTQHAGLAENVLDHRLNCRTVYMNAINRFLYWNMNYHVEHHMFPLVPYHALPILHNYVKDDCPEPYPNIPTAWREIAQAIRRQLADPAYYVKRRLPPPKPRCTEAFYNSEAPPDSEGWLEVCSGVKLSPNDVLRFDHARKTYALYRDAENVLYATDGICTHGNTHLVDGFVRGKVIECPKHNGRFNLMAGSPARVPICRGLTTYPVEERNGALHINVLRPGGAGARPQKSYKFRVVSNQNVATFIKELVLEPEDGDCLDFTPGDYLQFEIPRFDAIEFRELDIPNPYAAAWERQHLFDLVASNPHATRRNNYSLANNPKMERLLRFNVRIAMPPTGQDCPPGIGSSYVFALRPGDIVTAAGPFGDFHIKPTQREMVYIGGGAGMAPLRAHLSHLFESDNTARKVSFWYGARSKQEVFYEDYFKSLEDKHRNFRFNLVLSSPEPADDWSGYTGFVHEVVLNEYLRAHPNPQHVEYYLCGPPQMIKACTRMLTGLQVPESRISYDEF